METRFHPDIDCPMHGIEAMANRADPLQLYVNDDPEDDAPPHKH